jgi:hypothetical protein
VSERNMSPEQKQIADDIAAMAPADQLRLAAMLLDSRRMALALAIVERVSLELGALEHKQGRK